MYVLETIDHPEDMFFRIGRTETVCTLSQQLPISKGLTCLLRALDLIS